MNQSYRYPTEIYFSLAFMTIDNLCTKVSEKGMMVDETRCQTLVSERV